MADHPVFLQLNMNGVRIELVANLMILYNRPELIQGTCRLSLKMGRGDEQKPLMPVSDGKAPFPSHSEAIAHEMARWKRPSLETFSWLIRK